MSAHTVIFYLLAAFILASGVLAMTTRKIFRSAIFLLFTLIGVAGLYFWMDVQFIAAVQVIVYVGGIVVLIIFSIFLTQQSGLMMPRAATRRIVFSVLAAIAGLLFTGMLILRTQFPPAQQGIAIDVSRIGTLMLDTNGSGYALPFEVVSVLLLAAMVGCIVIAMRTKAGENE